MGSWFADLLAERASRVFRVGRSTDLTPAQMACQSDVVVISVPIAQTERVIRDIGPLVSEDGLLMDLTSVKKGPMDAMLKYSRAEVVGVHPLFGPDMGEESETRVVICPGRGEKGLEWLKGVFINAGMGVSILTPEKHDQMMGLIQGVNHFSTIALALLIKKSGLGMDDICRCSTQTFMRRIKRIRAMVNQPAELFGSLLMDNGFAEGYMDRFMDVAEELLTMVKNKDKLGFQEMFDGLRDFFNHMDMIDK